MQTPIVQFGTSRFLQAHVDLFVSQAMARGEALGAITVVQTTQSSGSASRIVAFNAGAFPVRIRGLQDGAPVDRTVMVASVARARVIAESWGEVEDIVVHEAEAIVSNTGDRGYEPDAADTAETRVPGGFPAKLARLLHARFRHGARPIDLFPCELIVDNGAVLREAVLRVASAFWPEPAFLDFLAHRCRWADSLVDRIVSAPLDPLGAVAEPYALWAIRAQPGLSPPCRHTDIVVTDQLERYERLKLLILNLGHSVLAERWLRDGRAPDETVRAALADPDLAGFLDEVYDQEVLPVFAALGMGTEAAAYRQVTLARFANPFLEHRLSDIAQNHAAKTQRRFGLLLALAGQVAPDLKLPRLRAALEAG